MTSTLCGDPSSTVPTQKNSDETNRDTFKRDVMPTDTCSSFTLILSDKGGDCFCSATLINHGEWLEWHNKEPELFTFVSG